MKEEYSSILNKNRLSVLDILEINKKIFGMPAIDTEHVNQRHRSFNRNNIFEILDYQKKYKLNNSQLAMHFKLSPNTVTKWKKLFLM